MTEGTINTNYQPSGNTTADNGSKNSRQQSRRVYRFCGELAVKMFFEKLGVSIPRKTRRLMGRVYGNAAYRYDGTEKNHVSPKYNKYVPHPAIVSWARTEGDKLMEQVYPKSQIVLTDALGAVRG